LKQLGTQILHESFTKLKAILNKITLCPHSTLLD